MNLGRKRILAAAMLLVFGCACAEEFPVQPIAIDIPLNLPAAEMPAEEEILPEELSAEEENPEVIPENLAVETPSEEQSPEEVNSENISEENPSEEPASEEIPSGEVSEESSEETPAEEFPAEDAGEEALPEESTEEAAAPEVLDMDWWESDIQSIFCNGMVATVTDVRTGISWQVIRKSGTSHADVQPLTATDTMCMKRAAGGWSWKRRAIWVTIGDQIFAASMISEPHGQDSVSGNDYYGHFCIHFTNSRTHDSDKVCSQHKACIEVALNTTPWYRQWP